MKMLKVIIEIFIVLTLVSCNKNDKKLSYDKLLGKDKQIIKFIRLYESYTDATFEMHQMTNYNMVVRVKKDADTLLYKIFGTAEKDIWPLDESKYCYLIDSHYIFSDTKLLSVETLSVDSVCNSINSILYKKHKESKEPIPPLVLWDCKTLKIAYINDKLSDVGFVWGE